MSKAIMISIQPKWCELIVSRKKTIEVRKSCPKLSSPFGVFKCYIYCTLGKSEKDILQFAGYENNVYMGDNTANGKVIGEFVCKWVQRIYRHPVVGEDYYLVDDNIYPDACLSAENLWDYGKGKMLYAWYISNLVIYDRPKELSEFIKPCIYGDDGEGEVSCFECEKSAYTPDMHIDCYNILTRPPQSWCYVEQLRE